MKRDDDMSTLNIPSFPCDQCGLCCRKINNVPELTEYTLEDGTCVFLINNLCSIYDERPLVCRVREMYEEKYSNEYTWQDFIELNVCACNELKLNR